MLEETVIGRLLVVELRDFLVEELAIGGWKLVYVITVSMWIFKVEKSVIELKVVRFQLEVCYGFQFGWRKLASNLVTVMLGNWGRVLYPEAEQNSPETKTVGACSFLFGIALFLQGQF